ncbi:MAG: endonuclease domain-containing protein [Desulfobaccales bacterium]
MRKRLTDAERLLWRHLRNRELDGWKFRWQYPVGSFIVDFICVEKNLVIEVDGGPHAETEEQDIQRSTYLNRMGYRVFRFWNNQVMQETEEVLEAILAILANTDQNSPSPQPSPPRGGEGEVIIAAPLMSQEKVRDRQGTDDHGHAVKRGIATGHYCPCPPLSKGG